MFRGIRLLPSAPSIPFMAARKLYLVLSAALVVGSILLLAFQGLNFGIDFRGGILMEVRTQGPADIGALRRTLGDLELGEVGLQEFGDADTVLIRVERQEGGEAGQQAAVAAVREILGEGVEYRRVEFVGPQVSEELLWDGIYAVLASMLAIMVYIWFRFEWQFGVCGVAALLHDVITTAGVFALLGLEFNLTTVAAILTIAGYSINDTVVVFDRVRENLRKFKAMPMRELIDRSLNQTLSRTIITGLTTLLTLSALYVLGGEVLRGFSFALMWGVVIGTYSSICLAVPLLLVLKVDRSGPRAEAAAEPATGLEDLREAQDPRDAAQDPRDEPRDARSQREDGSAR
jgi:preprotein translocase subunit SecF